VDSGLLDALVPAFTARTGYTVKTVSVGSGQALALGRKGEVDVLLVHSPADEEKLVADGAGVNRRLVMHNDFLLVGPLDDPAGAKGAPTAAEALKRIAMAAGARWVSRGDGSGTHAREKALWKAASVAAEDATWYQQTGLGMGETLAVASEKAGYTLTDRGTWLALKDKRKLALAVMVEGEQGLFNVYHVIEIPTATWPKVNGAGAKAFADYVVSPEAQDLIGSFGIDRFGGPLFVPDARPAAGVARGR
jgi:tungstate transport system substrate-binding protein